MSTIYRTTRGTTGNKYGLRLDEFFDSTYLDLSRRVPPSEDNLRRAIRTLSRPKDVSYETFELILAMEWAPTCTHLGLLLSESDVGVFPACIKLLQNYCQGEGRKLFDESYGFLCLQVIALSLEVAKLAQTNRLESCLSELSNLPANQSISEILNKHARRLEMEASFSSEGEVSQSDHAPIFGWYVNMDTGSTACLPQIGGCTILDIQFLLGKMWSARKNFLHTAKWASSIFSGWCGLLYTAWNIMLERDTATGSFESGGNTPEQQYSWAQFLEVTYRYSLCSSEIDDKVLDQLLTQRPGSMASMYQPKGTAVDAHDSNAITSAYLFKVKSVPRLDHGLVPWLFGYACTNLNKANFRNDLSRIVAGTFERAWIELSGAQAMTVDQWMAFTDIIVNSLTILIGMCRPNRDHIQAILAIISNKDLFEYLGRLLLFPLSLLGADMIGNAKRRDSTHHQEILVRFGPVLRRRMTEARFETSEELLITWFKISECFRFHMLASRTKSGYDYAQTWEPIWLHIGQSLELYQQTLRPIQCAYSRCAAPDCVLAWGCEGCNVKRYCSQRCREADWMHPMGPHRLHCADEGGA